MESIADPLHPRRIRFIGTSQAPEHLTYAIDLAPLSEAFGDFPEFDLLYASFNTATPLLTQEWKVPSFPLIRLTYTNYSFHQTAGGEDRPERQDIRSWHLEILPVPQELRAELEPRIIQIGLPLLHEWMTRPGFPRPETRRAWVELWWYGTTQPLKLNDPRA